MWHGAYTAPYAWGPGPGAGWGPPPSHVSEFPPWKRTSGVLVEWSGDFGWIEPAEHIQHRDMQRTGGLLHVAEKDIQPGNPPVVGAEVNFSVFQDGAGLGAGKVRVGAAPSKPDAAAKKAKLPGGLASDPEELKAELSGAKRKIISQASTTPLLAAFAKKAKVSVNPARTGVDEKGLMKANRQRITEGRVSGVISKWDGTKGKITPNEPIWNAARGIQIWDLAIEKEDVMPKGTELTVGMDVTFFGYWDAAGFGAESCMQFKGSLITKPTTRPATSVSKGDWWGEDGAAWGKDGAAWGVKGAGKGKSKWGCGKGKGKLGKGEDVYGPRKAGPRERITDEPMFGVVAEWKGKFGWIEPETAVEHPQAKFHNGKIYLSLQDCPDDAPIEQGTHLNFHIYADGSGLGAEDILAIGT